MQIANIKDLRKELSENYSQMKGKTMDLNMGKELANTAGKILVSCRVELEYNKIMGIKNKIDFLEG